MSKLPFMAGGYAVMHIDTNRQQTIRGAGRSVGAATRDARIRYPELAIPTGLPMDFDYEERCRLGRHPSTPFFVILCSDGILEMCENNRYPHRCDYCLEPADIWCGDKSLEGEIVIAMKESDYAELGWSVTTL